jgi:hypothetical protein
MVNYIQSKYYENYIGPDLISVKVDNLEDYEIYNKINELYSSNKNWNGKLYKANTIFNTDYLNKKIEIIFSYNNIKFISEYIHKNDDDIINLPIKTPIDIRSPFITNMSCKDIMDIKIK